LPSVLCCQLSRSSVLAETPFIAELVR